MRGRQIRGEEGQTLILVVLTLPLLLAIALLVVDGSNLFVQRRSVQNASDAIALAAASQLHPDGSACGPPCPGMESSSFAQNFSVPNGGPNPLPSCAATTPPCYETPYIDPNGVPHNQQVEIRAKKKVRTVFGGVASLFGGGAVSSFDVSARAIAGLSPVIAAGSVVPMAVSESHAPCWPPRPSDPSCVPFETTVTFDFDADPQGFSLIDLSRNSSSGPTTCGTPGDPSCKSTSVLRDWIEFGYPGTLPPAWYAANNGNKNGLKSGLSAAQKKGTVLFIPVFNQIDPPSSASPTSFKVIGFAAFRICRKQGGAQPSPPALDCLGVSDGLENWNNSGTGHQLVGQFTTFIDSGVGCGNTCSGNSFGVFAVTLFG